MYLSGVFWAAENCGWAAKNGARNSDNRHFECNAYLGQKTPSESVHLNLT
jgi:hypothetical protein